MLRELITWVLNTYLGKYLENFNPQQLSVALLSGEVELENVPLRKNALRGLGLPLQIHSGSVGKIKLQVPVRSFRTAPWCVIIERLYIVIGPKNLQDWDEDNEKQCDLEYKLTLLDNSEAKYRAQKEAKNLENNYYASSYSGWMSYGTTLATNIIENLQLKILDVHIRYEDTITIPQNPFACGIRIESLTAQSCDANWLPGTQTWNQNVPASYKLVELHSFAFYWDRLTKDKTFKDCEPNDLAATVHSRCSDNSYHYFIQPISAHAHFKQDRSETALRTRNRPRLSCDVTVNQVHLSISDFQYTQIHECMRGLSTIGKYHAYRLLRPSGLIKSNAKQWWIYAAKCHGYTLNEKFEDKMKKSGENIKYIKIYMKILVNPNENLSPQDKQFKSDFEKYRDVFELQTLREICFEYAPSTNNIKDTQKSNKSRSMLFQWFPSWGGWYGGNNNNSSTSPTTAKPIEQESPKNIDEQSLEDDILFALDESNANDMNSWLKRDAVFGKFDFSLISGQLNICNEDLMTGNTVKMIEMHFDHLKLNVEARPRSNSHSIGLSLGSVCVRDLLTKNTEFPELIKPQNKDESVSTFARFQNQRAASSTIAIKKDNSETNPDMEPWFQLQYEKKPLYFNTDYRLVIKTKSLDVVYNMDAMKWLSDFFTSPVQAVTTKQKLAEMKYTTKMKLIKNWKSMLEGEVGQRKTWSLEIDISAPQIIFVENFCNKNTVIVIVDFGRFKLLKNANKDKNRPAKNVEPLSSPDQNSTSSKANNQSSKDSEDEDAFMTPCSTPPDSDKDSPTICSNLDIDPNFVINENTGLENAFHDKIYDKYTIDLTDLQVLVCKSKERWSFASTKGSSALHVLDRFSISLELQRRIINTIDPDYPSITLFGSLPKLIAHVSEHKVSSILNILNLIADNKNVTSSTINNSLKNSNDDLMKYENLKSLEDLNETLTVTNIPDEKSINELSSLIILQFVIDQLTLEVQSRGRSIAELQVTGVRAGLSKLGDKETNVSLSVHGLLLVDAIQSFGPDFELLVASHRHVGMDSVSGSLKQSEPCSPSSPASPDPVQEQRPTSPQAITKAISSLQRANSSTWSNFGDLDALITMEINFIHPGVDSEALQIANINFNNLDIIANQETVVELLGFTNRVFPSSSDTKKPEGSLKISKEESTKLPKNISTTTIRTEITFDFHRLNVLVLRGLMRDSFVVGRKVGTFTMSGAKIHAVLSSGQEISVEGSLGGLQILDLTPEGVNHQRIVSVGKDPLTEPPTELAHPQDLLTSLTQEVYGTTNVSDNMGKDVKQTQALSFKITRDITANVRIQIRMASVWYTHCARFIQELNWCATEFKHYLKKFAKSIREKATDMAYGLVQPIDNLDEQNNQNTVKFQLTNKFESPKYVKKKSVKKVTMNLDIVLDTPVLVVPRSSCSTQVLVAHLGKIIISNHQQIISSPTTATSSRYEQQQDIFTIDEEDFHKLENSTEYLNETTKHSTKFNTREIYSIDVKNMNLFSLDTAKRKGFRLAALPRAEEFYSCQTDAVAILHDTVISLEIVKHIDLPPELAIEDNIHASVTQPLHISLSRQQFEQLLETMDNIFKVPPDLVRPPTEEKKLIVVNANEEQESSPFEIQRINDKFDFDRTDKMDNKTKSLQPKISFELPMFVIGLKNEHDSPLIEITFREFNIQVEQTNEYETNLRVSLRSVLMEDLLCPMDSKYRQMVASSPHDTKVNRQGNPGLSSSCPDFVKLQYNDETEIAGSLPENLEFNDGFNRNTNSRYPNSDCDMKTNQQQRRPSRLSAQNSLCPDTPPPSPQTKQIQDNLVIFTAFLVNPECPQFKERYKSMLQTSSIDFNCLSLIISVERWFSLLDFFGVFSDDEVDELKPDEQPVVKEPSRGNTELEITVRSLNLSLIRNDADLAKANVSNAFFLISKYNQMKTIEGKLGSVSLLDLTDYGKIYRERFLTSGSEALKFIYKRDDDKHNGRTLNKDATVNITMSSVRYVHTKRFIMEIQEFIKEFLQLQTSVMKKIKSSESKSVLTHQRPTQLGLEINAGSPIIVLPLSFDRNQVLVVDLGEFSLNNSFHLASEKDVISKKTNTNAALDEILDVMKLQLLNTNLYSGDRISKNLNTPEETYQQKMEIEHQKNIGLFMDMGNYWIKKQSKSLLREQCHLELIIERNMDTWKSHNCPEVSVQGTLSRLECIMDLEQYKLLRGFLEYNLGEPIDDIYSSGPAFNLTENKVNVNLNENIDKSSIDEVIWTTLSINLNLEDVLVVLSWSPDQFSAIKTNQIDNLQQEQSLACINFIKSCLKIDSFSDGSQDIDLVSQEILLTDSRFNQQQKNLSTIPQNVFTNILQPIRKESSNTVQAEIHSRKRNDNSKFTILLNNMRVMAIIDWIENMKDFIGQSSDPPPSRKLQNCEIAENQAHSAVDKTPFELILNITDSDLVFVEKIDQLDSNAIILKSTTVLQYKPLDLIRPMSLNVNHLEVFSCILGYEDETALSIIDPITINIDLKDSEIQIQMQKQLCIRLSYHDVKMFMRMMQSLPQQTRTAQEQTTTTNNPKLKSQNSNESNSGPTTEYNEQLITQLKALGFNRNDCKEALEACNNQLNEAALWLTQNREPCKKTQLQNETTDTLQINAILINAQCISIFVIDDCKDADVPLLEFSASELNFKQELRKYVFSSNAVNYHALGVTSGFCAGHLKAIIASDYYNRHLSGWEPIIEPWEANSKWNYSMGSNGNQTSRLNLIVTSEKLLKFNVTSTLIELWQLVSNNWTTDYYGGAQNITSSSSNNNLIASPTGYRRRTPFVPFSLKNQTGTDLWFKILLSQPGGVTRSVIKLNTDDLDDNWIKAKPNENVPFSFGVQNKLRHMDSHKSNLHQILVRVDGWSKVGPVSVDRVGTFFRQSHRESKEYPELPKTNIVFAVTLEGSAQKMITVRSSLKVHNRLEETIMLKMEHHSQAYTGVIEWPQGKTELLASNECYSIPLSHVYASLFFKPIFNLINAIDDKTNTLPAAESSSASQSKRNSLTTSSNGNKYFQFCEKSLHWRDYQEEIAQEQRICRGNRDKFYNIIVSIRKDGYPQKDMLNSPGHTINLLPPLRINNLLCCDLIYKISNNIQGILHPSHTANIHEVNLDEPIQLNITLDGYRVSGQLLIPAGHIGTVEPKLRLKDSNNRDLHLRASIQSQKGNGVEIYISAPYWLINNTGIPLVFRQDGGGHPASGQFEENETARILSPLMFSFTDGESSPKLEVRLGNRYGENSPWCKGLSFSKEISHRQLKASQSNETFVIGAEVRRGRGRYLRTSVVTFSPRFQLYNRSSYTLQFTQKCFIEKPIDPESRSTTINAIPNCHFPFHWPRSDQEPLLCVRIANTTGWSAGIPINDAQSLYVNCRNESGEMFFLRLEVILQGATYFLLFGDADALPPPIRIDNFSEVPIRFLQYGCKPEWRTTVKPHSSIAYSLDDPVSSKCLQIEAPGGDSYVYMLRELNVSNILTYSNFIYIAFKGTFSTPSISENLYLASEFEAIESQHLVLGVRDKKVILMRRCASDRSQLWLMNSEEQLEHEGSSPPREPGKKQSNKVPRLVLDLERPPNPMEYTPLVIRPANKQRKSTQTWKFTHNRLMCGHSNMCVQARNGVYGLRPGGDAVLGRIESDTRTRSAMDGNTPIEQLIERQKLRPGSGQLKTSVHMDGPIKTIQIRDVQAAVDLPLNSDPHWKHASHVVTNFSRNIESSSVLIDEFYIKVCLSKGIGISIITRRPSEELVYVTLEKINVEVVATPKVRSVDLNVADLQIDNQLLDTPCPILMYTPKTNQYESNGNNPYALAFQARMLPSPNENAVIYERVVFNLRPFILYLEERLILRAADFFGIGESQQSAKFLADESEFEAQQVKIKLAANAKRYYFEDFFISPSQIRLSVITASKLSPQLSEIKKNLGLRLVKFEDAVIDFEQFVDRHHFETLDLYLQTIKNHYKNLLKWQAATILVSVDFLGNPMGLANDLSEGVSGLIFEGSVKSLVKNVTHGISNSTAKLTETISDGLGRVVLDERDNDTRQKILEVPTGANSSGEHLAAGLKGLGFGLLGGVTSIVKHTYEGAQSDGLGGFIRGMGKGIVGTVTKPIIGVLDLASETANAVRETSKSAHRILPERKRLPRCITGAPGGLLPPFSFTQSKGQQHLYLINKRNFSEQLMSYEPNLFDDRDSKLRLLVSTEFVRIFSRTEEETTIILQFHLSEVLSCHPVTVNKTPDNHKLKKIQYYVEISSSLPTQFKRPRVRCQTEEMANKASRQINYAKSVFDEREQSLIHNYDLLE